jgi:hypothetical protein
VERRDALHWDVRAKVATSAGETALEVTATDASGNSLTGLTKRGASSIPPTAASTMTCRCVEAPGVPRAGRRGVRAMGARHRAVARWGPAVPAPGTRSLR